MVNNINAKVNQASNAQDLSTIVQKISEVNTAKEQYNVALNQYNVAIEQYKAANPDIDMEMALSEHKVLLPVIELLSNRELDKFISHAKEQGTKMPFDAMEMGILTAGRKDMQSGLAEVLNSLEFDKPICSECGDEMDNRGRSKKKS